MKILKLLSLVLYLGLAGPAHSDPLVNLIVTPAAIDSRQHGLDKTADGKLIFSWVDIADDNNFVRFAFYQNQDWSAARTVVGVKGKLGAPPKVIGLSDGALLALWMDYPEGKKKSYWGRVYSARSTDGGSSWSNPALPNSKAAKVYDAQMSAAALPGGRLALVWTDMRAAQDEHRYQLFSTVIDEKGNAAPEHSLDTDVCSCCPVDTAAEQDSLMTVYRDHLPGEVRDMSVIRWVAGQSPTEASNPVYNDGWVIEGCPSNGPALAIKGERVAAAWFTAKNGQGYVKAAFSENAGRNFAEPAVLDSNAAGYVDAALLDDGSVLVSWRSRTGPEDVLKLAKVKADGTLSKAVEVFKGSFPRWPSRDPQLKVIGDSAYVAWTDAGAKQVKLAAVSLVGW